MKSKVFILLIAVLMISGIMAGCGNSNSSENTTTAPVETTAPAETTAAPVETTEAPVAQKRVIGCAMTASTIEHSVHFAEGVRSIVEGNGDEIVLVDEALDLNIANKVIEDLIAMKVDGIVIEGLDTEAHMGVIKQANDAGIIVVQSDNWCVDESITVGQAASDNFQAGYECGLDAVRQLGDAAKGAKVIILDNPAASAAVERVEGFIKGAVTEGGMEIVAQQKANGVQEGNFITENLLQAHPDVNVIFGQHDPVAMGALAALKAANMEGSVLVYGVDGNQENLEQIKAGVMAGTAAQDPSTMGKTSAQFLYDYWDGKTYEKKVSIPCVFINKDNVDQYLK